MLQSHLLVLLHQVSDVLPSLEADVVLAGDEDQPQDRIFSECQVLNETQVSSNKDRFI